jgi:polyisoprenoid-binding protein YceI
MKSKARWIVPLSIAFPILIAQPINIAPHKSVMTVRVFKSGVFSALAHDHEISAPIESGTVDTKAKQVQLRVDARMLRVSDAKVSEKDRSEIQRTMLGPDVLDAERTPVIAFRSDMVTPSGPGAWMVYGRLSLRGREAPVSVEVSEKAGHYVGSAVFRQSEFGIKPIRVAGGTVRVKDEVRIEFDIQLARGATGSPSEH